MALLAATLVAESCLADSYTTFIPTGLSLIANQLDHGSNTANVVIPNPAGDLDGCTLSKWNCGGSNTIYTFDSTTTTGFADAYDVNTVSAPLVAPGEAFYFNNQTGAPMNLVFTGTPHVPVLPANLACGYGHTNYLSRQTNDLGSYENIVGLSPTTGSQEQIWTGTSFTTYTYTNGTWLPTNPPSLGVGKGAAFYIPVTPPSGNSIAIAPTNSHLVLTWSNSPAIQLQVSPILPGSWSVVTGAVSPWVVSPTNPAGFYRLKTTSNSVTSFASLYLPPTFNSSIGTPFGCGCVSPENPNVLSTLGSAQDNGMGNVLLPTGELTQDSVNLEIPGRGINWSFAMRYRSGMSYIGPMGQGGWDFNYNRRLAFDTNGNALRINLGRVDRYILTNGTFTAPSGFFTQLKRNLDGTFTEKDRHGNTNFYSATNNLGIARMSSISDRNGNQMTFQYDAGSSQLTNVVDTLGRSISYFYNATGQLTNVTDFAGRAIRLTYDTNGNLASITTPAVTGTPNGNNFPSGKTTRYTYSSGNTDPRFNHLLLSVTAPNEVAVSGSPRLVSTYDTNPLSPNAGRLLSLTLGGTNSTGFGAGGTMRFGYASFGPAGGTDFTTPVFQNTVTNRNGNVTQYQFNQLGNPVSQVQYTRGIRAGDPVAYTNSYVYNQDGELISETNSELSSIQYVYDSSNPSRVAQGNLLQTISHAGPRGGDQAQIILANTYETNFNFIATITDGRTNPMTFKYDSRGNCTNVTHRISTIADDYAFNAFGQMTNHVLPDNGSGFRRRDATIYYSGGPQNGYRQFSIIDAGGFKLTNSYAYDLAGNVTNSTDGKGSNTIYSVNALNQTVRTLSRPVATTNGLVRYQVSYFYDANNNLVRTDTQNIDDGGNLVASLPNCIITNMEDILDLVHSSTQLVATNHSITADYQYDANGNRILSRSGVATSGLQTNNTVSTLYDERDLVYQEILAPNDPDQSTTQLDYDGDGNIIRRSQGIESDPRIATFAYDGYGRKTSVTDAMGNVITAHYDANGNQVSARVDGELVDVPGSAGNVRLSEVSYTYDAMNRLVKTDSAFFDPASGNPIGGGHATNQTIYSGTSQVLQTIDSNGHIRSTGYNTACLIANQLDHGSNNVTFTYDANNNLVKTTEVDRSDLGSASQSFTTTNTFDGLDRLVQTVDNIGITNRIAYDSRDNKVLCTDGRGNVTRYTYDGLSRLTATTCYLTSNGFGSGPLSGSIITRQTWDDNSRLTGQTDNNTNTTTYVYDALSRMTGVAFADGSTKSATFDVHHNQTTTTDANGTVVNFTYDSNNRPVAKTITLGSGISGTTAETNQYDGLSRIITAANDGSRVTFSYDSMDDVIGETQQVLPDGMPQAVTLVHDGVGNPITCTYPGGRVINSTYDPLNRLQTVTNSAGLIATYDYFGPGRVERRDYGNGTRAAFSYDPVRRLTNTTHNVISTGTNFESRAYSWDASDNQTAKKDLLSAGLDSRTMFYDSANRLNQSTNSFGLQLYALDGVGNRLAVAGFINAGSYTQATATDRAMNQYTTTPFDTRTYDANGNLTSAGQQQFVYDYCNQMVAYTNASSGVAVAFKYDCFGRRLEKSVAGNTNRYYYAHWQEIEEQDGNGSTLATYVWGNGVDEQLTMDRAGQTYFLHEDSLGSICKVTDNSGAVAEQYRYDDFGQPTFLDAVGTLLPATQITNATLFAGRRYDAETGLYYYRTRYLEPATGRFTTRDSIGIWGDEDNVGNAYTYGANNPATQGDPSGEKGGDGIGGVEVGLKKKPGGQLYAASINTTRSNIKDKSTLMIAGDGVQGVEVGLKKKTGGQLYAASINTTRSNIKDKSTVVTLASGSGGGDTDSGWAYAASINTTRSNIKDRSTVISLANGSGGGDVGSGRACAASINTTRSNLKDKASIIIMEDGPMDNIMDPIIWSQIGLGSSGQDGATCAASINTTRSNLKDKASIIIMEDGPMNNITDPIIWSQIGLGSSGQDGATCAASINTTRSNLKDRASIIIMEDGPMFAGMPHVPIATFKAGRSTSRNLGSARSNTQ